MDLDPNEGVVSSAVNEWLGSGAIGVRMGNGFLATENAVSNTAGLSFF
jgi:hypothetical protein